MKCSSYLTPDEVNEFVGRLKNEHANIVDWLSSKRDELCNSTPNHSDPIDVASDYETYTKDKAEAVRKQSRLLKIEKTLKNMSDYGYCEECGVEIGKERLKIDPTFELCIDCSDIHFIKSRNYIK